MRSGSSCLSSYLASHPDITSLMEILHRKNYKDGLENIKDYLSNGVFSIKSRSRGFKLMYHQMWGLKTEGCLHIKKILDSFGCRIIHIVRKNKLEAYVSQLLAKKSGIWNAFKKRRFDNHFVQYAPQLLEKYNSKVYVDPIEYQSFCRRYDVWERCVDELYPDNLKIYYENMIESLPKVLDFLKVKNYKLHCDSVKLRSMPLEKIIINHCDFMNLTHQTF